jgi:hypothetical protein
MKLLPLISAYQNDPSSPVTVGALLGTLEGMISYIARTRSRALGGEDDARQDAITATLGVCRAYDLTQEVGVELALLGDVANALAKKVRRGSKDADREVPLDALLERVTLPPSLAGVDLALAAKRGAIRPADLPLLRMRFLESKSLAAIGKKLTPKITEKAVERRLAKALRRLQAWALEK